MAKGYLRPLPQAASYALELILPRTTERLVLGNLLAAQRLGLCTLTAQHTGSVPGRGTETPKKPPNTAKTREKMGFKTTIIYSLTVLEARVPKSRCWEGPALQEDSGENPSSPLLAAAQPPAPGRPRFPDPALPPRHVVFFLRLRPGSASSSRGLLPAPAPRLCLLVTWSSSCACAPALPPRHVVFFLRLFSSPQNTRTRIGFKAHLLQDLSLAKLHLQRPYFPDGQKGGEELFTQCCECELCVLCVCCECVLCVYRECVL